PDAAATAEARECERISGESTPDGAYLRGDFPGAVPSAARTGPAALRQTYSGRPGWLATVHTLRRPARSRFRAEGPAYDRPLRNRYIAFGTRARPVAANDRRQDPRARRSGRVCRSGFRAG